jgi:hypothetical protein
MKGVDAILAVFSDKRISLFCFYPDPIDSWSMASSSVQVSTNDWESKDRQAMGNCGTTSVLSHCLGYVASP